MTRLTKEQIEFARTMTIKQRRVLSALSIYPDGWFMSASERADPELYDLIRHRLVQCHQPYMAGSLPAWGVTHLGKRIAERQAKGAY
ncbi:hypothetical protein EOW77_0019035 [Bradyrhizobium yuanmingense]|uniref:hypothetical protein n=1 Tax=Bradyrhizobium yuanmingense TaxID=108015 RepID=UPI000FE422DF|nr:hypothetical protein [Bradyrhizobium yuanmingense]TGN86704.1 hypothetical protein EOW77_0019035 [Bradyrhizobium yuanmingense]